jgi:hypothetical protein
MGGKCITDQIINAYKNLVEKPKEKRLFGGPTPDGRIFFSGSGNRI